MALFDKEILERIGSLEDLNKTLSVVSIRGWVVLLFFALLAIATIFWAVWGSLPVITSGKCIALTQEEGQTKNLKILGFISIFSGHQIKPGMKAQATLDTVDSSRYGMIEGIIKEVIFYPVSASDLSLQEIPSQPLREYLVSGDVPTILIVMEPNIKTENISGFEWTSKSGPPIAIESGSVGEIQVTLETIKPISYVIPRL